MRFDSFVKTGPPNKRLQPTRSARCARFAAAEARAVGRLDRVAPQNSVELNPPGCEA